MTALTSRRRWPLLLLPVLGCMALLILVIILFGLGDIGESFKRFANSLLTSFTVASALLAVAMLFYADSRDRPLSPVMAMLAMATVGAALTLGVLSFRGDLLLESNGSAMAQILYNVVQLLVISSALFIALGLVIGTAFAIITRFDDPPIFEEE